MVRTLPSLRRQRIEDIRQLADLAAGGSGRWSLAPGLKPVEIAMSGSGRSPAGWPGGMLDYEIARLRTAAH